MRDNKAKKILNFIIRYKKVLVFIIAPLLTAIIPIVIQTKAAKCAFIVILMSIFWITEALPISITALFPVLFYPLLGILKSEEVCPLYFKDIVMLFFGGLVVASAIEITRLHERLALFVLLRFGSDPKWLMLGFMIVISFLSLWISNTSACAMMLPVVEAVVKQLVSYDATVEKKETVEMDEVDKKAADQKNDSANIGSSVTENNNEDKISKESRNLATGFMLACAYSASIGGMGSIVGTAPNVLLKGYFDKYFPDVHLDFLSFMLYALPVAIIMVFLSWAWLSFRWLPKRNFFKCCKRKNRVGPVEDEKRSGLTAILREKYASLGPMKWAEKCVGIVFILLVLLWLTHDLHAAPGWEYFFLPKYTTDATAAMLAVILLFMLPKENIFAGKPYDHLISWKSLEKTFPWAVFLLLGGSLAMADGFQASGLSAWIGSQLTALAGSKKEAILIIVQIVAALATEFTSNASIASIFLPILESLSKEVNVSPVYFILPMILSVSLAFTLPVATPSNAMVFATGRIRILDMITTGIVMNIIGLGVIFLASNTWLGLIFNMNLYTTSTVTAVYNTTNSYK